MPTLDIWRRRQYTAVTGNEEGHQMDQEAANPRPNPIGAAGQEAESMESFHSIMESESMELVNAGPEADGNRETYDEVGIDAMQMV